MTSHCKPSTFAYATQITEDDNKGSREIIKAVLSTTAKAKAKKKAEEAKANEGMDVDEADKTEEKPDGTVPFLKKTFEG